MTDLAAAHAAVTVDLGAGDGQFVLAHAAAQPNRFVLGIDASSDAMREASCRAARSASRGGLPNARFVVSALEALPADLDAFADLVTAHFPWGSLRDAAAGHDPGLTARIARLVRPGGQLRLVLSAAERDRVAAIDPDVVGDAYAPLGMRVVEFRPATLADAIAAHSSWGKRLLRQPARGRVAWSVALVRPGPPRAGAARIDP